MEILMQAEPKTTLFVLGQIGGYAAGAASWLNLAKDFFGLIGILCGAALSVWALYDKIQSARQKRKEGALTANK